MLYSLAQQEGSIGAEVLRNCNVSPDLLSEYLSTSEGISLDGKTDKENTDVVFLWPEFTSETKQLIQRAATLAMDRHHQYIGTEHLLFALVEHSELDWSELLRSVDESLETIRQQLLNVMNSNTKYTSIQALYGNGQSTRLGKDTGANIDESTDNESSSETPALDYFGTDLTASGTQSQLDPVIGRADEIERLIHILSRRTKNNPVLIGEAGVGKTAIVEGLARRIVAGDVPDILLHKRVVALDLSLMIAGTMYRGEFESRIKQLIDEVRQNTDIILFVDELHTLVGAGTVQGGSMDAANILKPALAKGHIRCIGATTSDEYRKFIEADPALDRRFQSIRVNEPTEQEAVEILQGLSEFYEDFHYVKFTPEALTAAVDLAVRFLPEQRLPDKAIDLLDEAGAKARVQRKVPAALKTLDALSREAVGLRRQKETAVRNERYQTAVEIKAKETKLEKKLVTARAQVKKLKLPKTPVTIDDIARVVASVSGVPYSYIAAKPEKRFVELASELKKVVIGQDTAVDAVCAVLRRSAAGLSSGQRPLGSFLFLGPSGVGKTELAKKLAETHFGDNDALLRIDMSEFSESFTVSKMVGAPAGYVGYNDTVKLADHIRRKPYSVVLFDEIEKAHPDIFNVLLQILDEGKLTDSSGRELNFRHSVLVLTSNIGIDLLTKQAELGFDLAEGSTSSIMPFDEVKAAVLQDLQATFPQEFLSRIDKQLVFEPLSEKSLSSIIDLQFSEIAAQLERMNISVRLQSSAKKLIVKEGYEPDQGARGLRRVLTDQVENLLAEKLLSKKISSGDHVSLAAVNGKVVVKKDK